MDIHIYLMIGLDSPHVSRNHAVIKYQDNNFLLSDCGSKTGTWIGIKNSVPLKIGKYPYLI